MPATFLPPARKRTTRHVIRLILLVMALTAVVHQPISAETTAKPDADTKTTDSTQPKPTISFDRRTDLAKLPRPVVELIDAIFVAINSGDIEELRTAIEWNEMPPAFASEPVDDPIAFLKNASADKSGRQMLAVLGNLFAVGPAHLNLGRDPENSGVYVWPYLSERPLDQLTPEEEVHLYRIVPLDVIAEMRATKRWTWYRVVIGADGTWHSFMRHE